MSLVVLIQIFFNIVRIIILKMIHGKRFSAHMIQRISFLTKFKVINSGRVLLGKNICISRFGDVYVGKSGFLEIGDKVYFNLGAMISCQNYVKIGNRCLFGPDVKIYDNDHKFDKKNGVSSKELSVGEVVIGDNCWIASNVVILKNTRVGDNCIIGAGVVLKGEIPPNSLVTAERTLNISPLR